MSMLINPDTAFSFGRFGVAVGPLAPTIDFAAGGYTIIGKYYPMVLNVGGAGVRLTLKGPVAAGHTCAISKVTISLAANTSSADLFDSSATPTNVTFRGGDTVSLTRNSVHVSDEITFTIDRTRPILIAYNIAAGSQFVSCVSGLSPKGHIAYARAATSQAATANRTAGYAATPGYSPFLHKLECYS